jgi:hypothetical protein
LLSIGFNVIEKRLVELEGIFGQGTARYFKITFPWAETYLRCSRGSFDFNVFHRIHNFFFRAD